MKRIVTVLCVAASLVILASAPVLAQAEFDIKIYPSKLELTGAPGSTQDFVINVENQGGQDQVMKVYFNDYFIRPDNEFVFKAPGHYSYSCAKWLSTASQSVSVEAGTTAQVPFKLAVPVDAEPGGHYGVIFFEQVPPQEEQPVLAQGRIGVTALVTVPGEIIRKGEITSVSVTSSWFWPSKRVLAGPRKVTRARVVFKNEGNVHLTVKGKVTYTPTFGWGTGTADLGEITVLPKTTRYMEAVIPSPPLFGSYKVRAEVSYGPSLDVFDTTVTDEGSFHQYPFFWLAVILGIVILVIGLVILFRRLRRRRKRGKGDAAEDSPGGGGGKSPEETAESEDEPEEGGEPENDDFQLRNSSKLFDPED